jgi:hypothetical protein
MIELPNDEMEKVKDLMDEGKEEEAHKLFKKALKNSKIKYLGKEYTVTSTKENLIWTVDTSGE